MAVEDRDALIAALSVGDFNAVLGTAESQWLDFKGEPYQLDRPDRPDQPLELVKDITALANGGGGILVLGYATEKDPQSARDVAKRVRLMKRTLINEQKYRGIIEGGTYPPLRGLTFHYWPATAEKVVVTISVPATETGHWPTISVRTVDDVSSKQLLVGMFQRQGDQSPPLTAPEIHALIQLGRLVQRMGLSNVVNRPAAMEVIPEEERLRRLDEDTQYAGFQGVPRYFLQAWPGTPVRVRGFGIPQDLELRSRLSWPQAIRQSGFGIRVPGEPTPLRGGGVRLRASNQAISLQANGLLTWIARADYEWLSWLDNRRRANTVNPLTLVESTLEFVRLFQGEILPRCVPQPADWRIAGGMAELLAQSAPISMTCGPLHGYFHEDEWQPARASEIATEVYTVRDESPGVVAFAILRDLYAAFDLDPTCIPYARDGEVRESQIACIH